MIAMTADDTTRESAAVNNCAVIRLVNHNAQRPKPFRHGSDAITLFDT